MDARLRIFVGGVFDCRCRNWSILAASATKSSSYGYGVRSTPGGRANTRRAEARGKLPARSSERNLNSSGFLEFGPFERELFGEA